jgi:chloramphenicol O-acetyltransferase type A
MKIIDLNVWKRKEHFEFFSQFDEPFFGVVSAIDCTIASHKAKEQGISFFASYLHKSLKAVNAIEEFRCRVLNDQIVIYDSIHASATIAREDDTFAFSFVEFSEKCEPFEIALKKEIEEVQNSSGLRLNEGAVRHDVIHYSSVPWFKFTGLSHARSFTLLDSSPKITFGKIFTKDKRKMMAVSINAHHGLVDGIHVAKFLELFQKLMNE